MILQPIHKSLIRPFTTYGHTAGTKEIGLPGQECEAVNFRKRLRLGRILSGK